MDPPITTTHNNKPTPTPTLINGRSHHHHHQIKHPHPHPHLLYRECLKNHAAALGGHAVDGCGEFMPSATSATCDPSSLVCAACGCHRNFHRRLPDVNHRQQVQSSSSEDDDDEADDEGEEDEGQSGPHMLLALSAGLGPTASGNVGNPVVVARPEFPARKRFRSRFSPEQKEKMHELSERLGWRMQRRDDGIINERCREMGVGRSVFKVWMHNNKHNYITTKQDIKANIAINGGGGGHGHGSNGSENASSA